MYINSKKSMKKAKENWIGEWCDEIKENLRKNNSKEGTPTPETLDYCKTWESDHYPRSLRKLLWY